MDIQLTWLLDEKQDEAGVSDLRAAIEAIGDKHLPLSRQAVRYASDQTLWLHSVPTLAYGSIEFTKAIRQELYPGRWCDWTALRCERYYARLGAFLLNDDYILLPAGEVRRRQNQLLQQRGEMFLRPVRADKPFSGFVARTDQGEEIEERLVNLEDHDLVVVAPAKVIDAEYRTVAVRGKGIVAASQYMQHGQLRLEREVLSEVRQVAEAVVRSPKIFWHNAPVLAEAAANGSTEIVKVLLDCGSDINATDQYGWTALMNAASGERTDVVLVLLSRGANIDTHGDGEKTALKIAIEDHHPDVVQILKRAGARE